MASIEEHVHAVQFFLESNSAYSVHALKRGIKNHCRDDDLLYGSLPEGAEAMTSVLQQILGWQRRTKYLQILCKRVFCKTWILVFM